jgi:hypothetical protein
MAKPAHFGMLLAGRHVILQESTKQMSWVGGAGLSNYFCVAPPVSHFLYRAGDWARQAQGLCAKKQVLGSQKFGDWALLIKTELPGFYTILRGDWYLC